MIIIQVVLIVVFGLITFQDIKERLVYWFLFPLVALCVGGLHYLNTLPELFYSSVIVNFVFVSVILLIGFFYAKFKLNTRVLNTLGLGDFLLFFSLIFAFAPVSFIFLLTSALIFSLILHLFLSKKQINTTVPLAGYMSLFFGLAYLSFWFGIIDSIYKV